MAASRSWVHSSSVNAVFHRDAKGLTPSRPPTTRDPLIQEFFHEAAALRTSSEEGRRGRTSASYCTKITYGQRNVTTLILRAQRFSVKEKKNFLLHRKHFTCSRDYSNLTKKIIMLTFFKKNSISNFSWGKKRFSFLCSVSAFLRRKFRDC